MSGNGVASCGSVSSPARILRVSMGGSFRTFSFLCGMKESYSICFTSHGEVMFRDEQDHGMFVNIMAIEGYRTESEILSGAEMSNHVHFNAFTRVPMVFASRTRMAYTKYFNRKYGRKGRMGEKGTYILKVDGFNHQLVLSNYVLRQGLHHCAAATAFGYPFSSIHELFASFRRMASVRNTIKLRSRLC